MPRARDTKEQTPPGSCSLGGQVTAWGWRGQGFSGDLYRSLYSSIMADLEREHISVTEASGRGVARLVADAAHGAEVVVTRRGAPVAAVVSVERLAALDELRRDLRDLALVVGRAT